MTLDLNIERYLSRIGLKTSPTPSLENLQRLQRAHLLAIPFENIDVQLGQRLTTDVAEAYEKIVVRGRGGWCYEQNGLFGWALQELGFDVTRMAAGVMRQERGAEVDGNHLCLLVKFAETGQEYLVDVGFGGSMVHPLPLKTCTDVQAPYTVGVRQLEDGYWRFWEDPGSGQFSYDFRREPASEAQLEDRCRHLQTDPSSGFVLNLVAELREKTAHKILRGRVFKVLSPNGPEETLIESATQLVDVLASEFHLDVPQVASLWPRIVKRHEEISRA